jgi:hypothetical protein
MASYKTNIKNAIKLDNTQTVQKQYTQTTWRKTKRAAEIKLVF